MPRMFVFGGPGLPPGTHTYYADTVQKYEDGGLVEVKAFPGDRVPADRVDDLQVFLERGLGRIEEEQAPIEA